VKIIQRVMNVNNNNEVYAVYTVASKYVSDRC